MGLCGSKESTEVKHDASVAKDASAAAAVSVPQQPVPAEVAASAQEDAAAAAAVPAAADEYLGAPAPVCELNRIKHLHDLNILYTPPEQRFDDITKLCTLVFKVGYWRPALLVPMVTHYKALPHREHPVRADMACRCPPL
jgi:hypothetical protein